MELGATICLPKTPRCEECLLRSCCLAHRKNLQDRLPIRSRRRRPVATARLAAIVRDGGKVFLSRRSSSGRLSRFWELPGVEQLKRDGPMNQRRSRREVIALRNLLKKKFALSVGRLEWLGDWKHHITKFAITLKVFEAGLVRNLNSFTTMNERKNHPQMECRWLDLRRLKKLILPAADRRVLRETLFASKAQGGDSFVRKRLKDIADGERSSHFLRRGGTAPV